MTMTVNEALARQNFINKILLKYEGKELTKALKVKLMAMRIALAKIKNEIETFAKQVLNDLKTEEFNVLTEKTDRTEEENNLVIDLTSTLVEEYNAIMLEKGKEEVIFAQRFTEKEFGQIVEVNASNNANIAGIELEATQFLEIIYSLFVEE